MGPLTLRRALEQSRNIPAVKVIEMLGPTQVAAYAQAVRLLARTFRPFLSMALGAQEATLIEIDQRLLGVSESRHSHGSRISVDVDHRSRRVAARGAPAAPRATRSAPIPRSCMTNLLRGVVQRGTGAAANALDWPLAGKTGTVDDYTDAWFVGFDPNITVGVWVGNDEKKPIG